MFQAQSRIVSKSENQKSQTHIAIPPDLSSAMQYQSKLAVQLIGSLSCVGSRVRGRRKKTPIRIFSKLPGVCCFRLMLPYYACLFSDESMCNVVFSRLFEPSPAAQSGPISIRDNARTE